MEKNSKQKLNLSYLKTEELKPYQFNSRSHSKKQVKQLVNSIKEFDFVNPIILDENREIIAGHGRFLAAKELDLKTVPVVVIEHLSEEQKRIYRIADNKLTENGDWDNNLLCKELTDLSKLDIGIDLEITGFDTTEIDLLIDNLDSSQEKDLDQFDFSNNLNPVSKPGDIWIIGKHKILCGDSTRNRGEIEALFENQKAQMIFTDPPYNVPIDKNVGGLGSIKHREFKMASGEMTNEEFEHFLLSFIKVCKDYSTDGSLHYIFMDWRHIESLLRLGNQEYSELKNLCIWNKSNGGMGTFYRSQHEEICIFKHGKKSHINNFQLGSKGRYRTNVWNYPGVNGFGKNREDLKLHPTVKPVELIKDAILDVTKRKQIVFDPFLGSGSTLIAAEETGRICYGVEIDPIYVDTAIERFQKLTDIDAVHQDSGKTYNKLNEAQDG